MSAVGPQSRFVSGQEAVFARSGLATLLAPSNSGTVQFLRYSVVGAVSFAADIGTLFALTQYAHMYYLASAAIAFLFGLVVNYVLSLVWVFGQRVYSNRTFEFGLFAVIGVIGLGLNEGGIWVLKERLGFNYLFAKVVTAAVVFSWNFGARKMLLFSAAGVTSAPSDRAYSTAIERSRAVPWATVAIAGSFAYFILASAAVAYSRVPWVDEGSFIASATNIVRTGLTGNPSVPPWGLGIPLPQSQVHNFWVMPGFLYTEAAWFRIFPTSIYSARALSIVFGIIALVLFYRFVRSMSDSALPALLALALLATDFNMVMRVGTARMDSMSLAFNFASWLAYLGFRRRSLPLALGVSCALASCGLLVHPNGIFAFVGLGFLVLAMDLRSVDWRAAVYAAVASAVPLLLLVPLYLRAPDVWQMQVRNHSQGRFVSFLHPVQAIKSEFLSRYYIQFGGVDPFSLSPKLVLLLVLAAYFGAVVFAILVFRRAALLYRFALGLFAVTATYFTFFEAGHFYPYNIHLMPWFCILLAGALIAAANNGYRRLAIAAGVIVVLVNMGATAVYVHDDRYHKSYIPVLQRVESEMGPNDLLLSHAYFGIPLGYNRVTEDYTLVTILRRHPLFVTINQHFQPYGPIKTWVNGPDPAEAGMIGRDEKVAAWKYFQAHYALVMKVHDYDLYKRVSE